MSGEIRTNLAPQIDVSDVVDILVNMFGEIMDRGAIAAVVESYNGDLDQSTDAILKLSEDDQALRPVQPQLPLHPTMLPPHWPQQNPENRSYAMISQQRPPTTPTVKTANKVRAHIGQISVWTDQLKNIVTYHNKGFKTLILMRGASGAGKTYLSNAIVEITVGKERQRHVFSADDFFQKDTGYEFNPMFLEIAHNTAKMKAYQALYDGVSPVIIDNTNTQLWEMEPYVFEGVKHGYIIELVEPNTSWARNAYSLASRNTHGVTLEKVRNMLDRFEHNLTGNIIINKLRLSYPQGKMPPNIRSIPPFEPIIEKPEDNRITVTLTDDTRDHTILSGVTFEIPKENTHDVSKQNTVDKPKDDTADKPKNNTVHIPKNNTVDTHKNNKVDIPYEVTVNPFNVETREIPNEVTSSNNAVDTSKVQFITNTDNIVNSIKEHSLQIANNTMLPQEKPVCNNISNLEIASDGESACANIDSNNTDEVKVLAEWDSNEKWGDVLKAKIDNNGTLPKHQRLPKKSFTKGDSENNIIQGESKDWRSLTSYLSPWNSDIPTITKPILKRNIQTHTEGTNTEAGDSNAQKSRYKVLRTECREINKYHLPEIQKIPHVRMFDKSTMTLEPNIFNERNYRCKNEEKHFLAIRSMFKTIARSDLRDVFEYCRGDPNWTVSCILDSVNTNEIKTHDEDVSDCEDIVDEPCDCVAKYQIIPYVGPTDEDKVDSVTDPTEHKNIVAVSNRKKRRTKGQTATLESNLLLKKQLEESVSISGAHYSPQTLKLRNERHGRTSVDNISALSFIPNNDEQDNSSSDHSLENASTSMNVLDNTSEENESENEMFAMSDSDIEMSSEYDEKERQEDFTDSDEEKTVFVGYELIRSIGKMFNEDFVYPKGVLPLITMPKSLIHEIHALWLESLSHQLTCQEEFGNMMVKEDEEFARKLAAKEEEMARQGKEPEVPDFKEIMDMDLALSIYQKEIADWKNKEPTDLASKMTRDKLYNLFPDKSKETLSEILIAYNNDFKTTVEVLLSSIGRHDILKKKNGLNKFIMDGELARQKRVMDEQKLQRSKQKSAKTGDSKNVKKFTLDHVFQYRQRAQMHLNCRNKYHQKAQKYLNTDHTGCAYYYSSCAKYHKDQFEHFNGHAASALIQVHAQTNADTTLDLHYLFVAEAIEAIDLFVDHHIQVVRASRTGRREHVYIVTGRGIHSNGKPKIKPAAISRLKQRGFDIVELNPGLLAIELRSSSQLMSEMKKKEPPKK